MTDSLLDIVIPEDRELVKTLYFRFAEVNLEGSANDNMAEAVELYDREGTAGVRLALIRSHLEAFAAGGVLGDIGLTCVEAENLAAVLRAAELETEAGVLLECHAQQDEEGDAHYVEPEAEVQS
jgi:hypothetical protein